MDKGIELDVTRIGRNSNAYCNTDLTAKLFTIPWSSIVAITPEMLDSENSGSDERYVPKATVVMISRAAVLLIYRPLS